MIKTIKRLNKKPSSSKRRNTKIIHRRKARKTFKGGNPPELLEENSSLENVRKQGIVSKSTSKIFGKRTNVSKQFGYDSQIELFNMLKEHNPELTFEEFLKNPNNYRVNNV